MDYDKIRRLAEKNANLIVSKNTDYGSDNLMRTGLPGIAVRLQDKVSRLRNLTRDGVNINHESIADTLADISNYGLIGQAIESGAVTNLPNIVYLAGPVRSVGLDEAIKWRRIVSAILNKRGITTFDPASCFWRPQYITKPVAARIESINRAAIDVSDVVLACYDPRSMNIGTIRELEYGSARGKRCIFVCEEDLDGKISAYDLEWYLHPVDAVAAILQEDVNKILEEYEKLAHPLPEPAVIGMLIGMESDRAVRVQPSEADSYSAGESRGINTENVGQRRQSRRT